ncbi:hypothetical protein CFP56_017681 [Quercus suber]|uniref:Secreted protein n=1 Tax=Quercus suber TaxID=58331 RepID=A0AAW0M1S1_QUESU
MATNSNATKVLQLLKWLLCFAGTNHSWDILLCGFEKKRRGSSSDKRGQITDREVGDTIWKNLFQRKVDLSRNNKVNANIDLFQY